MADEEGDGKTSATCSASMTKISRHTFTDDRDRISDGDFSVDIIEV